ncbi:hypothetical protein IAD21_00912 [Abditibacteriota bacterium]|nr:hypothetical protein IAD21_00912 [Abditibacteriota bacterium]
MAKELIQVSGIWLRGVGTDSVEVLAEIEGEWRVVIPPQNVDSQGQMQTVSHCVHPAGMEKAPVLVL